MKKLKQKFSMMGLSRPVMSLAMILTLSGVMSKVYAQNKKVVVNKTMTAPDGSNYHALESMVLDTGFVFDSQVSGEFYVETGDFMNAEPSYGTNRNKVVTEIAREATSNPDTLSAWGKDKKQTLVRYSDGLGRTVQQTHQQGSPLGKDLIQFYQYDQQGRRGKMFLPYVGTTTDGSLHTSAVSEQSSFYNNSTDDIADSSKPFAEAEFDDSPLGRVLKMGAPGSDWQLSSGNTPVYAFKTNDASTVRQFTSAGTSSGFWAADQLFIRETNDENDHVVEEYGDPFGRVLLKRVEQSNGVWAYTYHIYDDYGRLKYTIQPEGYEKMVSDNNYNVSHVLNDYVFSYQYDSRGRLVEKKVPGADAIYYVYDVLDRLVLTQDGILRAGNKWRYMKYDALGRVVMTGIHTDGTNTTRQLKQTNIEAFDYTNISTFEIRDSSTDGYTDVTYPTTNNTVHSLQYYDNYDFDGVGADLDYSYVSKGFGNVVDYNAVNRATGTKHKILGTSTWLWEVYFYDSKGRLIQTRSSNELQSNLNDASTTKYHFDGRVDKTLRSVDANASGSVSVANDYHYDDAGRLTKVYQTNDSDAQQQVAEYKYNELGQLAEKQLHHDGTDFLQSVDYRYNIRGWLTQINGSDLTADNINNGDAYADIFGMDLMYNTTETGIGNTAFFNGNISAVKWQANDPNMIGTKRKRSYAFGYDRSDRLLSATYKAHNGTNWTTAEQGAYDVSGVSYDKNGNILGLSRYYQQNDASSRSKIDDLAYTYSANRLTKVTDSGDDTRGYTEGTDQTTEYTYDANGNILTDVNKGLTYTYNDLNKTEKVEFNANKYIQYTYSTTGRRIKKRVYDSGAGVDETWRYIKGFVFKDSGIDHFAMNEGVVRKIDGNYRYEYFLKDHQGNTRMSFAENVTDTYLATMETATATYEEATFFNVDTTRHDDGMFIGSTGPPNAKLSYMDGMTGEIGLATYVKVSPRDVVNMSVWSTYTDVTCGGNCVNVTQASVATAVASLFGGTSGAGGEAGAIYDGINAGVSAIFGAGPHGSTGTGSRIFLNWIYLDDNYTKIDQGFTSATTSITQISLNAPTITQSGYFYVYLSNESGGTQKAYFDNFSVSHTRKIAVLQENHYYPFGLSMEGVAVHVPSPSGSTLNKYLYNAGSEKQELDIRTYDTPFRQYDPALGRFQAVDPLADFYSNQTPYQYGNNDPLFYNDPLGLNGEGNGQEQSQEVCTGPNCNKDDGSGGLWEPAFGSWFESSYFGTIKTHADPKRLENGYDTKVVNGVVYIKDPTGTEWVPAKDVVNFNSGNQNPDYRAAAGAALYHYEKRMATAPGFWGLSGIDILLKNVKQRYGIVPYTDSQSSPGQPDVFENPETLESAELTNTSMPVVKDGMPATENFMDLIWNAIKVRMWGEKVGSKIQIPASDTKEVRQDTIWGTRGHYRLPENDTLYHIDGTKMLKNEGKDGNYFPAGN